MFFEFSNCKKIKQKDFIQDIGLFSVLIKKKSGTERTITNLNNNGWNSAADVMKSNFEDS